MTKPRAIAVAAALLFMGAVSLRLCRPVPAALPYRPEVTIPPLPGAPTTLPTPAPDPLRAQAAPSEPPSPDRLLPFLESLGRARLLRDRRTLGALEARIPPLFDSDLNGLRDRFGGDLFVSAGIAELARLLAWRDAVPPLAAVLGRPGHELLKDIIVETLAVLGGDGAEVALLSALRNDADDAVRLRCAAALSRFQGAEVVRSLLDALHDPVWRVRTAAAEALARLNATGTVDALLRALGEERDPAAQADLVVSAYASGGEATREALVRMLDVRPEAGEILRSKGRLHDDSRYRRFYDRAFFEPGGSAVPFDAAKKRIGITLEPGAGVSPREVGLRVFGAAPLDRYRDWFFIRKADDFPAPTAYDSYGNPMQAVPYGDLEGTVFLHFQDPTSFAKGVLGYTQGCNAFVQGVSLMHEFGHAFARLGDEYPNGSRDAAANLFRQDAAPWLPLVAAAQLPPPQRRDAEFVVPSDNCYLNNNPGHTRFCPVCQLEIHARMAELAGAPLPW